jgi:nucleoside-diphosphate-sugar epimerase
MKILFTGGSSFTGFWFIKALAESNDEVFFTLTKSNLDEYSELQQSRIRQLNTIAEPIYSCTFGSEKFVHVIKTKGEFDLFCHHAANVVNYKSEDYNIGQALQDNTRNLAIVLDLLKGNGCNQIVLTGSVFEGNEGTGMDELNPFSPYGLSKQFTAEVFRYFCLKKGINLAKFVIPNPFGPFEEKRFTNYLITAWGKGQTPLIRTPLYIRDNIHISLLAKAYVKYVKERLSHNDKFWKLNPSGYIENQGDFTRRFSQEMGKRLLIPCQFEVADQTDFSEPLKRYNYQPADKYVEEWDEPMAWDELAEYYKKYVLDKLR